MSADRDPRLDTAWRVHSTEAPSTSIDATILAAAHRAVASAPHATSKVPAATQAWAWWMPLAAAAAIGAMAIGVIQLMPHPHDDSAAIVSDTPADAPSGSRAKARVLGEGANAREALVVAIDDRLAFFPRQAEPAGNAPGRAAVEDREIDRLGLVSGVAVEVPNSSSAVIEWMSSPARKAALSCGTSAMCAANRSSIWL